MTEPREFTLAEARATLQAIRDQVRALQDAQRRLRAVKEEINVLNRRHLNNGVVGERRLRTLRRDQRRIGEETQELVRSITRTGAEIKSIDDGLLDFPTTIRGVPAYWCWRADEDDITWWHPRSTGFAGRQSIADLDQ